MTLPLSTSPRLILAGDSVCESERRATGGPRRMEENPRFFYAHIFLGDWETFELIKKKRGLNVVCVCEWPALGQK